MDRNDYIFGIRPVIEAIEAGRDIDKIFVSKELHSDVARELLDKAREMHVLVQRVPPEKIQRITRKQTQGAGHTLGCHLPPPRPPRPRTL